MPRIMRLPGRKVWPFSDTNDLCGTDGSRKWPDRKRAIRLGVARLMGEKIGFDPQRNRAPKCGRSRVGGPQDFHAVDRLVAPGFVTRSIQDGTARIVTFANGNTAREELVTSDDQSRRLVYAITNERLTHYNAAVQVFEDGPSRSRLVWTVDFLPDALASYIDQQMDEALKVMQPALTEAI